MSDADVQGPTLLGTPAGVRVLATVDAEEIHIERERHPIVLTAALLGVGMTLLLWLVFNSAGLGLAVPAGLAIVGVVIAGFTFRVRLAKLIFTGRPEVVTIDARGISCHGERLAWTEITSVGRTVSGRGSGILLRGAGQTAVGIGGYLRPSQADWLEHRIAAHRARAGGDEGHDEAARAALDALRDRGP